MKYWRELITATVTLLIFGSCVWFSNVFQTCIAAIPNYQTYEQSNKGSSYFFFSLFEKVGCLGPFVDRNSDAIIAVFTIVLTFSTIAMWWETRRMASGGEEHSRDMKATIKAAQTTAGAAADNAKAAVTSGRAHMWMKDIGLNLVLRPDKGVSKIEAEYEIWNGGSTPGLAKKVHIELFYGPKEGWTDTPVYGNSLKTHFGLIGPNSGHRTHGLEFNPAPLTPAQLADIYADKIWIIVYGFVVYADIIKPEIEHRSGYAYRMQFKPDETGSEDVAFQGPDAYWEYT